MLILLCGGGGASSAILPELRAALEADPLIASAQPMFASPETDSLWAPWDDECDAVIGRGALLGLPRRIRTMECVSACILVRPGLLTDVVHADDMARWSSLPGAVWFLLSRARRRGLRNACCTRAIVVTQASRLELYPQPTGQDIQAVLSIEPLHERFRKEDRNMPWARLAPLLGMIPAGAGGKPSLLLDCRGLAAMHNGTSRNIMGQLQGFAERGGAWDIEVLSTEEASDFHRLAERFPMLSRISELPQRGYTGAFLLSQPWDWQVFTDLHRRALVIGFNMLDTIAWDIGYAAPPELTDIWRVAARHADVLTYISHFSRERFQERFFRPAHLPDAVVHLSLDGAEYIEPEWRAQETGDHVLLFGNHYDHKGIAPVLGLLSRAFPNQSIVVIGGARIRSRNVRSIPSGSLTDCDIHALLSSARVVIYPSFYEGFGLPAVEGLSYGRPVLVRESPLWEEIAAHSRLPGDLVSFRDDRELIDKLGRLLVGLHVTPLAKAGALAGGPAPNWASGAERTLAVFERAMDGAAERWLDRDIVLSGRK
ncbi:glycosyltransferase [Roseococcus sp. YIM B11640]|uniref:glycosyltransferase n=1 Tax=Roseococcus sp. YIM B11640 TaxID=3133973 RepID=UPI003C7B2C98